MSARKLPSRMREAANDAARRAVDGFVLVCSLLFRLVFRYRVKRYARRQRHLRRVYGIEPATPVRVYDECTRAAVEKRFEELVPGADYAYTSGSTRLPKKIVYDRKRLRRTRRTFVEAFFRYLSDGPLPNRSLFIFSPSRPDNSLTTLLLREESYPPYLSGLQAPHRVQNHPALRKAALEYGDTALRLWILTIANPGFIYATNPSTIATFLSEIRREWSRSKRLISDYLHRADKLSDAFFRIHRRIASRQSILRLRRIAESPDPLPVEALIPALRAYSCWDGGYVKPFLEQIRSQLPESRYRHWPMYSMSTEIIQTVPGISDQRPYFLPMGPGVLYEFIEESAPDLPEHILEPGQLIPGRCYTMVVSDGYGLRRYQTEDLFRCAGFVEGIPDLRFERRRNLSYSFTGEKLTAEQLMHCYREAGIQVPGLLSNGFLTCFPSKPAGDELPCYRVVLVRSGDDGAPGSAIAASLIQEKLCQVNSEFRSKIESRRLGPIRFETISVEDFAHRADTSGVWQSQFKILPLYPKLWEALQR